ncbi:MAG TPA: hypothetical protein VL094_00935 [Sphingomonadaceae bacterium]|nr:hypothetical protein [Sphingomonadaceae bacterium]
MGGQQTVGSESFAEHVVNRGLFAVYFTAAWTLFLGGIYVALQTTLWLEVPLVAGPVLILRYAFRKRATATHQAKTASWGSGLTVIGIALFTIGLGLHHYAIAPPPFPTIVTGAGIWTIGAGWMCAAALWNGSWFVSY